MRPSGPSGSVSGRRACGAAALLAALTAYIRAVGGSLGLPQDFSGIMAKPQRMALLTFGLAAQAVEGPLAGTRYSLLAAGLSRAIAQRLGRG